MKLKAEKDQKQLPTLFKVVTSKFYHETSSYCSKPKMDVTLKNNTSKPISRAYFKEKLDLPARVIPWVEEEINFSFSGGIESGEEHNLI